MRHLLALAMLCGLTFAGRGPGGFAAAVASAEPDAALAARIFAADGPADAASGSRPRRPAGASTAPAGSSGYIGSTWELASSVGYSGRPIDILVGVTPGREDRRRRARCATTSRC